MRERDERHALIESCSEERRQIAAMGASQVAPSSELLVWKAAVLLRVNSRWTTPVCSSSTAVFCPMDW